MALIVFHQFPIQPTVQVFERIRCDSGVKTFMPRPIIMEGPNVLQLQVALSNGSQD